MVAASAVQATWLGGVVGTSFGRFWFQELLDATARQAAVDSVRSLLNGLGAAYLQTGWSIQVEQKIQNFDLVTGKLQNEVTAATRPPAIAGAASATAAYAKGVGARIVFSTGVVLNGRKVIGRSFLCPLVGFTTSSGDVTNALITTMAGAIATYVSQPTARPAVWHKVYDRSDTTKPPVYTGGSMVPINGGAVQTTVSSLRSRRY
jgi:hypothetical protein